MKNPLYKDNIEWDKLSLEEQLEALRIHYCTGPCGQSQSVLEIRSRTSNVLKRCKGIIEDRREDILNE